MKNNSDQTIKLTTIEQISAGGVAFRQRESEFEVALISVNPSGRWQLPKGLIDAGETNETAALREVREEAGIETEMLAPIEIIAYWYFGEHHGERVRFHKSVHFFLLKYLRGEVTDHDSEVLEARWVAIEKAAEMLAFEGEKSVVAKAAQLISEFSRQ